MLHAKSAFEMGGPGTSEVGLSLLLSFFHIRDKVEEDHRYIGIFSFRSRSGNDRKRTDPYCISGKQAFSYKGTRALIQWYGGCGCMRRMSIPTFIEAIVLHLHAGPMILVGRRD